MKKSKPKIKSLKEYSDKKYPYGGESAALAGALGGASMGMEFGPWGALAGAGIGAGLGYMNEQKQEYSNKEYLDQQNLNNIRSQGVQRIKSAPIVEGAPQAAYGNGGTVCHECGGTHEYASGGKHWIQKAVNPAHKGYCTPMTKSTCTPHRKALAMTFKKHHGFHKHENGGIHQDFLNDAEVYNYTNGGITGFTLTPSDYFPNGGKYVTPLANLNNFYPPMKKQLIAPTKKYADGGMSVTNDNNAEVEKEEVMRSPDGSTMQVDGNSHAQGGVPVNIPNGTQIYSDRLKDPDTKKTFAHLASKYKVNKEEEILENKKSSSLATNTAKLNMQIKQQKLNEIFNKQELLKRSKVGNYAKKLGVDISQFQPSNDNEFQESGNPSEQSEQEFAYGGMKYPTGGWMNQPTQYNQVDPQQFGASDKGYTANYDGTNSGLPYSSKEGTFDPMGNKLADPYGQKLPTRTPNYRNALVTAGNLLGPVYGLATNVAPQTYDIAKPEFKQYNPANALAQADQENRLAREQARVNSGGNASAYLSSLASMQSNLTRNKAGIQQQYDQLNTGTYNQAQLPIAQMQTQRNIDRQHDVTANRDFKTGYIGQIGNTVSQTALSDKASQQDMDYLNWLKQVYPNVRSRYNPSNK